VDNEARCSCQYEKARCAVCTLAHVRLGKQLSCRWEQFLAILERNACSTQPASERNLDDCPEPVRSGFAVLRGRHPERCLTACELSLLAGRGPSKGTRHQQAVPFNRAAPIYAPHDASTAFHGYPG
jgi:hypothetical protein